MGGHQHGLAGRQFGRDLGVPIGLHPLQGGLQALGVRQDGAGIAAVLGEVELAAGGQGRRRHVIGAAPHMHLVRPMLGRGLRLVEPGEAAIMTLVQPPVLGLRHEHLLGRRERQPHGADRPGEHGGVGAVDLQARLGDQDTALGRLGLALGGKVHIHPPGEAILEVPLALAMAKQDQGGHVGPPDSER